MYSADAMRIALADAGDALDDANFEKTSANASILRLTKELTWIEEVLAALEGLRSGPPTTFFDKVFENAMNIAVHRSAAAFDKMLFRDALKYGCFDLMSARDTYRFSCKHVPMNRSLVERYLEVSTLLLVPFAPHTMDHIWVNLLKKASSALTAGWPAASEPSYGLQQAASFIDDFVISQRRNKTKLSAPPKNKKGSGERKQFTKAEIVVSGRYLPWQEVVLKALTEEFDPQAGTFTDQAPARVVTQIKESPTGEGKDEKQIKRLVMPFTKFKMEQALSGAGIDALQQSPAFDEAALLEELEDYLKESIGLECVRIQKADDASAFELGIYPGNPNVTFS